MNLKLWQVDAFARKPLEGNPAAIIPLESWLDAGLMQKIARENNLSETAFFVETAPGRYDLRWFTPEAEIELAGHPTLATAWAILKFVAPEMDTVTFNTRYSGELIVSRAADDTYAMSLPVSTSQPFENTDIKEAIGAALGIAPPKEVFQSRYPMAVWDDPKLIRSIRDCGDIARVLRPIGHWGLAVTAKGDEGYDFISRFFAPDRGIPEDPVTGSAHTILTPYWSKRLSKKTLRARQVSPRGGDLTCTDEGLRVVLSGSCALYLEGTITI